MGLFDFLKPKPAMPKLDPLRDLVLDKLRVGFVLDYEGQSWEVTAFNLYDMGRRGKVEEWALTSAGETLFLERFEDDEVVWSLFRKIQLREIQGNVRQQILENEDPPDTLVYKGDQYHMNDSQQGYFLPNGEGPGEEFISWNYLDESGLKILSVEQWDEDEFDAVAGLFVKPYQFSNILPGRGSY